MEGEVQECSQAAWKVSVQAPSPIVSGPPTPVFPSDGAVGMWSPSSLKTGLVDTPDPNLNCSICCAVFTQPMRTSCGHVFCGACLEQWLEQKADCPECRAPLDAPKDISMDRFANSLVSNLRTCCPLHESGCSWVGKRGERDAHVARDCPCAIVHCPKEGCAAEVPRSSLEAHLRSCGAANQVECPFGCGVSCAGHAALGAHKNECLREPRKLLAAVEHLRKENEQLAAENRRLKAEKERETFPAVDAADEEAGPRTKFSGPRRKVRRNLISD
jgi:hypothetical protein